MKKKFDLWLVLCVCLLSSGCGKEEDIIYYTDELLDKNGISDVEVLFELKSYDNEKSVWYYGLRKGRDWFALFDKSTNSLVKEWYGKDLSTKELDRFDILPTAYPHPAKIGNNEYLLWRQPCAGRINTDIKVQLVHLQTDGTVKYGKALTNEDKYEPSYFVNGKGWYARSEISGIYAVSERVIYDSSFENIIVQDVSIIQQDSLEIYTGFHDDKLWIGFVKDLSLTNEYLSEKPFERKRKVYLGYGEYEEYTIKYVSVENVLSMKWGCAFLPSYPSIDNEYIGQDVFLLNAGKLICCSLENEQLSNSLRAWYKESILVGNKYVISPQGEILCKGGFPSTDYNYNYTIPTSYCSWLEMDQYGIYKYEIGASYVWRTSFKTPITNDAKITYTLVEQDGSLWTFRYDIVNYDGSKEKMIFKVNIESGELIYLS